MTIDYPILLRPKSYGIFGGEFARPSPNLSHNISTNFSNRRAETEQLVCANYCYNNLVENEPSAYITGLYVTDRALHSDCGFATIGIHLCEKYVVPIVRSGCSTAHQAHNGIHHRSVHLTMA